MKTLYAENRYRLAASVAVVLPLALLLDLKSIFYIDWINHTWLVSYYSEYFRVHHSFPHVVNSQQIIGLPNPIFYGHAFYAVGGLFGSILGPDVGVRIWILLATAAQFYAVDRLFRALTAHRGFSLLMAVLVTWAIYPLTNLYNRSAITEYVAVALATVSVCAFLEAFAVQGRAVFAASVAAFFFTLAALIHPITGVMTGLFLAVLCAVFYLWHPEKRSLFTVFAGCGALSAVVLAPWFYALYLFSSELPINQMGDLKTYPLDTLWSRLAPFPFDNRSVVAERPVSTPHLDAQINMSLIVTLAALWWSSRAPSSDPVLFPGPAIWRTTLLRGLAWFSAIFALYLLFASLGWYPELVPGIIRKSQLGYRLITYVNLGLLCVTVAATQALAGRPQRRDGLVAGLSAAFTVCLIGLMIKLSHAEVVRHRDGPWQTPEQQATLPSTMYSLGAYSVPQGVKEAASSNAVIAVMFSPSLGSAFGEVKPVTVSNPTAAQARTNVFLFPWNRLVVDGRDVERTSHQTVFTAFDLPAGDHVVEYRYQPDGLWNVLRVVSHRVLALWALVLVLVTIRRRLVA